MKQYTYLIIIFIITVSIASQWAFTQDKANVKTLFELVKKDIKKKNFPYPVELLKNHDNKEMIIYDDFNKDGKTDIAAIFSPYDPKKSKDDWADNGARMEYRFLAIAFAGDKGLKLVYNEQAVLCAGCGGAYGEPDLQLSSKNGVIELGDYGGSAFRWGHGYSLRYEQGRIKVIGLASTFYHNVNGKSENYNVNYNTMEYYHHKYNMFKDIKESKVWAKLLAANKTDSAITIDGSIAKKEWQKALFYTVKDKKFVTFNSKNWKGKKDLSFSTALLWDDANFYISLKVKDDNIVEADKAKNIIHTDHIEIWIDLTVPHYKDKNPKRAAQIILPLKFAKGVYQPAASSNLKVQGWTRKLIKTIKISAQKTKSGYNMEISIPYSKLLGKRAIPIYEGQPFPFTILVSDSDNLIKPRQDKLMGTSQYQFGNDKTTGKCWFRKQYRKPELPFKAEDIYFN